MKKTLVLLFSLLLLGSASILKAQCYGVVNYDQSVNANGNSSFDISTTNCNELIMISYDGWPGPGTGPVTVDGNNATWINTAFVYFYAVAETYAYIAPSPGVHHIICSESPFGSPYFLNSAADFYVTGSNNPLTIASLTNAQNTVTCVGGGTVATSITTTIPGSMIYSNFDCNNGQCCGFVDSWTGATWLNQLHEGNGIDQSEAYTTAAAPGAYPITANCSSSPFPCGGLALLVVAIPPPLCGGGAGSMTVTPTVVQPTCGNCNGSISLLVGGGIAPYTYTWTPNISTNSNATGLCAGSYTCVVQDHNCPPHDTTLIFNLTGNSVNVTATNTGNEPCFGDCVGSATSNVVGGVAPYAYSWLPSGGSNSSAANLCKGTYTVTVHDVNGCTGTATVTITQPTLLTATAAGPNIMCHGGTTTLTGTANGGTANYTYLWTPGGNTNAIATGMSAGTYTNTVTDANGCTASASVTVTQPAAGVSVSLAGPALICIGGSGTLTANAIGGSTPYAYAWPGLGSTTSTANITPVATQTYTVDVTDANGCTASADITVQFGGPPMNVTITGAGSMCSGLQTSLCANVTGGTGGNTFLWQPGNLTTPCITISPNATTIYTVTVEDNCGSTANTTITVHVNPLPAVNFSASLYQGCTPMCTQFYNTTTLAQGSAIRYTWAFGNGDTVQSQSPIYCYTNSGKYDVSLTVTSDSGCSSTLKKTGLMTAYTRPKAAFSYSPQDANIMAPTIQFSDNSSDAYGNYGWLWSFGDGSDSTSRLQNPSHTYQDTGTFCPTLVAMNEHGCTDTATSCLVINPIFTLYIPSAFSPNGGGKNEVFMAKGNDVKSFEMYIFDRWGTQLFHSNDINVGWNGTVGGGTAVAQEDTYVYMITAYDNKNKKHSYTGNVSLIK